MRNLNGLNGDDFGEADSAAEGATVQIRESKFFAIHVPRGWQPAVNVYRCACEYIVCVELAGVDASSLRILAEAQRLVIRGRRSPPEPDDGAALQVLAMEIDYGPFERVVVFPLEVDVARIAAERGDGLVWIRLPLAPHA